MFYNIFFPQKRLKIANQLYHNTYRMKKKFHIIQPFFKRQKAQYGNKTLFFRINIRE